MLVLSRKAGERLIIGDDITITVTKCGQNRVVLGIDAPKDVQVKRAELLGADRSAVFPIPHHAQSADEPAVHANETDQALHRAISLS